jgi:hypothetical protein
MQKIQMRYMTKNGQSAGMEQSIRNTKQDVTNNTDHTATTIICSLLFRGILVGTKSMLA